MGTNDIETEWVIETDAIEREDIENPTRGTTGTELNTEKARAIKKARYAQVSKNISSRVAKTHITPTEVVENESRIATIVRTLRVRITKILARDAEKEYENDRIRREMFEKRERLNGKIYYLRHYR